MTVQRLILLTWCSFLIPFALGADENLLDRVEHGYVDNDGVQIHYAALGEGPLIVMLHGFPDYWYTWRHLMESLAPQYQVVAVDLRGYNRSDKPKGVENYAMRLLISDVAAVIQHFPQKKAILVGHDWGAGIAWQVSLWRPGLVDKLIVLSTPHPNGLRQELSQNTEQKKNSQYARDFQAEDAHLKLNAEELASWVQDEETRKLYLEAFKRSDFEAMLAYYKASFPKATQASTQTSTQPSPSPTPTRRVSCPTLGIFGLQDKALLPQGWNGTWDWVDNVVTLVSIPEAGHFVQQDARETVSRTIQNWLNP